MPSPAGTLRLRLCCGGLAALLAACGGGNGEPVAATAGALAGSTSPATARPVPHSDLEIARLLYTDSQRTPAGFYAEPDPPWTGQVATFHLKNTDLAAVAPGDPRHELCTDDWSEALRWSEQVASDAPAYSDLVETAANARWFEFNRSVRSADPRYLRMRVFRCSYLQREGVDLDSGAGNAGTLNQRPVSAPELALLAEYLWRFTLYNNFGHAVLASRATGAAGPLAHEIVIASLERGPAGGCDRVTVAAWTHRVDAVTGALTLSTTPLWGFRAREGAGVTELCAG